MAKGAPKGKSSASSATRKKQAQKAAKKQAYERDDDGNLLHPELAEALEKQKQPGLQRGQKKDKSKKDGKGGKKGKAEKKKQYIPPPKPPQPLPDPLDSMGLASLLPADLVVLLRKASKKDVITRCRALEGLLAWVEDALGKSAPAAGAEATEASSLTSAEKKEALVMMLPSWVHLFPRLALAPTRRLRLLTTQIQTLLLERKSGQDPDNDASTRSELLESPQYIEAILGPWAILCHDTDRTIERLGRSAWLDTCTWKNAAADESSTIASESVTLDLNEHSETLIGHLRTILLSSSPSYALSMTAAHAVAAADPSMSRTSSGYGTPLQQGAGVERDAKNRDDSNVEEDTAALDKRLVAGALAVLTAIVRQEPGSEVIDSLDDVLSSRLVWASLSPHNLASSRSEARSRETSFGFESPAVRLRAWSLLRALFDTVPEVVDRHLQTIGPVALTSIWQERDNAVQRTMLEAALPLLKKKPELWLLGPGGAGPSAGSRQAQDKEESDSDESDSDDDEDDEDNTNSDSDASPEEAKGNGVSTSRTRPHAYTAFLQWLQSACGGAPHLGYPAVIVFISTIPAQVLPYGDLEAASDLLTQFFSALYSRALDFDPTGCRAFLAAFVECVAFLTQRMARQDSTEEGHAISSAKELVRVHFGAVWDELLLPKKSLLNALGVATEVEDSDGEARAQRVKSIGSTRIVSDLAVQVRRLASAAPGLQLLAPFLDEVQAEVTSVVKALLDAPADVPSPARTQLLSALERATAFYAALAPVDTQSADGELRQASASSLSTFAKLAASSLTNISGDADMPHDIKRTRATLLIEFLSLLLRAMVSHPDALDAAASEQLAQVAGGSIPQLTTTKSIAPAPAATFLAAYLPLCKDERTRASIWTETLSSVAGLNELSDQVDAMTELVAASAAVGKSIDAGAHLPVPPSEAGIEDLVIELVVSLCDGSSLSDELRHRLKKVVAAILAKPDPFVDRGSSKSMLSVVTSTIEQLRSTLLERAQPNSDVHVRQRKAAVVVEDLLDCLDAWSQAQPKEEVAGLLFSSASSKGVIAALSDLFALHTASKDGGDMFEEAWTDKERAFAGVWRKARDLHQQITQTAPLQVQEDMRKEALGSLQEHLLDIQVPVVRIVSAADFNTAVLPEPKELAEMMVKASKQRSHPALLVFDPLVPQGAAEDTSSTTFDRLFDQQGLGIFARVCFAALLIIERDRANARRHLDLLPLVVMLSVLIEDDLLMPGASKHALDSTAASAAHRAWLQSAVTVVTALVSSLSDTVTENWHNDMVASLQRSTFIDADEDGIGYVLSKLWQTAYGLQAPSSYLARIFHRLLNAVFSFGTVTEAGADRWLKLGDAVQDRVPAMSAAIFYAAKPIAGSSPGYDRLRNGAAAKLSGLGPTPAQERMLQSLRALVALAPPVDSDLSIIPQQRAIFLLKDLQKGYTSEDAEEEPAEEASTRLAELFVHLLPVVQDVQGSHLDFVFDVLETNLEFCTLDQDETVAQLFHTLQLLETMRDLATRNTNLREYWKERSGGCVELVRELFLSLAEQPTMSAPKQACIDLVVELIRETSEAPFKLHETAAPLCKLMVSASHEVQVLSFRLLTAAIREHVKELVVESAVDREALATEEGQKRLRLPEALVANVSDSLSAQLNLLVEEEAARRTAFGYFLSWIAVLEHFEGASLSVKSTFLGELEARQLLPESLLPTVFALVGLADESRRPFDPSRFVLEEVFLDEMDAESSLTVLQVLAAHVYLRALIHVPTTVRSWWVAIKDRQHSMAISGFTTRHCSPVIAKRELSHLRQPDALAKLQDEAMSIKILSTNEVIATYVVDEHPMEIGVKIPADFPLHGVEIRDIQRVGITEAKWRSWLLAVGQLITGQNGLIFDALSLFKRNAEVQFQGLDECAICYSIISPMDRSLPTKPCKTCKNKFHAGCLFKWISTSGASTCPLCRSIL